MKLAVYLKYSSGFATDVMLNLSLQSLYKHFKSSYYYNLYLSIKITNSRGNKSSTYLGQQMSIAGPAECC